MELKSLKNIETTYSRIRLYAICFVVLCLSSTIYTVYETYEFAERQREKVYVLDNGKSLMVALSQDISTNRPVEAREHIRRFHELFFTVSPDEKAIKDNVSRALNMADKSAYNLYQDMKEKGFYNRLISGNIFQRYETDSIVCDFDHYPYKAFNYGKTYIVRESNITQRLLVTTCELINTVRSDNNPQGFMIKNLNIVEQKDLQTIERIK